MSTDDKDRRIEDYVRELSANGFVFLDARPRPYYVSTVSKWLHYWHPDHMWVTLKKLTDEEIERHRQSRLPDEAAEIYHRSCAKRNL
jgi:hypothetical protein